MTAYELVDKIRNEFDSRMKRKTGWGKNEVMAEFEGAVADAVSKIINLTHYPDFLQDDDIPF